MRRIGEERERGPSGKPVKVMAFDEARFGLINWHRRRYCPEGFRPPRVVRRRYEWRWLYAAVEPKTGESFCSYMPGVDGRCLETFFEGLGEAYSDHHLVVVLDNAPSHRSKRITLPENMTLLKLPAYSPELNPAERWFLEFRRSLSNKIFESVEHLQRSLTRTLEPYWREPTLLKRLTGYSWWVEAVESL
ncbi:MAG: IS630 family transposase [Rubrobacteraceae bacterium]